ncbi:MAG: DNA mismatch repair protein MutS [Bacteroidales bacterium]|nr:DNA mismatch repair protein MutS [Bacteroidales bacterium]
MRGKKEKIIEDTPLLKQYFSIKAQNPDAVLLFRVGDFYEAYSDDAVLISKVLGIQLTHKSNGEKGETEMAGVPHHAMNVYLPKLVRAGYKVAVCDQLEDPKLTKKLVKRGVTEIVTPGVAFGDEMLNRNENNFLAGLSFGRDKVGAAFLDVSTGTFKLAQGPMEYISALFATMAPKELIVPREAAREVADGIGAGCCLTTLDEWAFVLDAAEEKLCRQLGVNSLKGFAVEGAPLGIQAAGALLVYLEQTHHSGLQHICSLSRIDESSFVWMDRFTVRNLEIFASTAGAEGTSLLDVTDRCCTPMGSRLLRQWMAMPLKSLPELAARHDIVQYMLDKPFLRGDLRGLLDQVGDLERRVSRAAAGKILPRELASLGRSLGQMRPIRELCGSDDAPSALRLLMERSSDCESLVHLIGNTLCEDPAVSVGKGDIIAAGVNAELDELRELSRGGKEYLLAMEKREAERTGIPGLKIKYNNVFGYYIEVRNSAKDRVPEDWVRRQTVVNAERYITEELKEYESKILSAESKIYELESALFAGLVRSVQASVREIQENCLILSRLDVLTGFALTAEEWNYCRPEMNESRVLDIRAGRHPVIEQMMAAGDEYVPNDLYLDSEQQQIIVLTGPNMAGKSALLRQSALIVLLAQIGSFVPADSASIGWCDKIFTRVGATDNISRGESTFMVEMLETSMIMHNLSERSLVLMDEIGRGTSTYDGMSIARALVEYLHEHGRGAKTLFATHYHELNDMEGLYPRVKNFHIAVKEQGRKVIFLRKLKEGGVAHSFGIHVASMAGMPKEIIRSAERTLEELESGNASLSALVHKSAPAEVRKVAEAAPEIQLSLFALDDPTLSSIRDSLKAADLDNMTPLQAFDLLRRMKQEVGL